MILFDSSVKLVFMWTQSIMNSTSFVFIDLTPTSDYPNNYITVHFEVDCPFSWIPFEKESNLRWHFEIWFLIHAKPLLEWQLNLCDLIYDLSNEIEKFCKFPATWILRTYFDIACNFGMHIMPTLVHFSNFP